MAKLFNLRLNWRQWTILLIGIVRIAILCATPPYYDDRGLFGSIDYAPVGQIPPDAETDPDVNAHLLRVLLFFTTLDIAVGLLLYRSNTNIWQEVIAATWSVSVVGITMGLGEYLLGLACPANLIVCGLAIVATIVPMALADKPQRSGWGLAGVIAVWSGLGLYACALGSRWAVEALAMPGLRLWPTIRGIGLAFAVVGLLLSLLVFRTRIGKAGVATGIVAIITGIVWLIA